MLDFASARIGLRLLGRLPGFLRSSLDYTEAVEIRSRRVKDREKAFLSLMRRGVYGQPQSLYHNLLDHAGCEYGDLRQLVEREGLEGALGLLFRKGVYLTTDEFKGRVPIERGSLSLNAELRTPTNPLCEHHVAIQSSGSRGNSGPVLMDLAYIQACAVNAMLVLEARDGSDWLKADWETPGGSRFRLLKYSCFGAPPVRWFSQLDPVSSQRNPVHTTSALAMRWGSWLAGVPLPRPEHTPVDDPILIARWMRDVLDRGEIPHLFTFPSSAVCLCQSAWRSGIDLSGAQLTIGGEPITEARMATIRRTGATAMPRYGTIECGPIGYGCLAPDVIDDVHLMNDLHGLIQAGPDGEPFGFPPDALFVTTLQPAAPFLMLNVSMGDQATMGSRECGCSLETLGWATHLHKIRSFEKLTSSGMTFMDTDVIRVLEEVLPSRFGGSPTDYQLLEQETEHGQPVISLLVHPNLGPLNADDVAEAFLTALVAQNKENQLMGTVWRDTGIVRVERQTPRCTRSGKILHLHQGRGTPC